MNLPTENSNSLPSQADADEKLLVAYLDGELAVDETSAVEQRLAREVDFRARLHGLQQSWDMLDQLPSHHLDESFTRSTIEMVVKEVHRDRQRGTGSKQGTIRRGFWRRWRFPWRVAAAAMVLFTSACLSYLVARYVQHAPQREFLSKLEFFENLDLYHAPHNIEFLKQLDEAGVLPEVVFVGERTGEELDSVEESAVRLPSPKQRLEQMTEKQLMELRFSKDRYDGLPQLEKNRFQDLHREIMAQAKPARMLKVARDYMDWLKSINVNQRRKVLKIDDVDSWIAEIRKLRSEQEERILGQIGATALPKQDVVHFAKWVEGFVNENFDELWNGWGKRNMRLDRYSKPLRPYLLYQFYVSRARSPKELIDQAVMNEVLGGMSEAANTIVGEQGELDAQIKLINAWIVNACRAKTRPHVTDQALYDFLQTLPLNVSQRFDDMNPIQWRELLERLYYRDHQRNQ